MSKDSDVSPADQDDVAPRPLRVLRSDWLGGCGLTYDAGVFFPPFSIDAPLNYNTGAFLEEFRAQVIYVSNNINKLLYKLQSTLDVMDLTRV